MSGADASTKVDREILQRAHYAFQAGCFVSTAEERTGGIAAFSEFTSAPMWNHSAWLGGSDEEFRTFLQAATSWHNDRDRAGVLYLSDLTTAQKAVLEDANYEQFDQEAWMVADSDSGPKSDRVVKLQTAEEMQDFVEIFTRAFAIRESGYKTALLKVSGAQHQHFLLAENGRPVAAGTLVSNGRFASLYNIATAPGDRQKGFGSEIVRHLLAVAREAGCETIFLQVENDSAAKRLYEKLGFRTDFVRIGYRQRTWQPARQERSLLSTLFPFEREPGERLIIGRESRPIPAALVSDLRKIFPATPIEEVFMAAWACLLNRYTAQSIVSFAVARRRERENFSVTVEPARQTRDWIATLKKDAIDADDVESSLCFTTEAGTNASRPTHPLELHFERFDRFETRFRADLFTKDTVRRIAAHYLTLLESISREPRSLVSNLEILPEPEKHQLLVAWNQPTFTPTGANVIKLFEEQVERTPEAIALNVAVPGGEQLTYRQLNRRANRVAHRLQEMGVGPGTAVGILLDRSTEMVIALLAVLKAAGVCVPIDPASPAERIGFVLQDVDARVLLTKRATLQTGLRTPSVLYLDDGVESAHGKDKNLIHNAAPENAAYIIYTSGSTGRPKGVIISHSAFANHCLDCRAEYGLSAKDRVLQFAAFHFDAAFEQTFPPLITGATLVLRDDTVWTAAQFGDKLREHQLTVVDLPTAYWHELADYWSENAKDTPPHCLRLVIVGGEALSPEKLGKWRQSGFGKIRLINAYGPTETTITAVSCEISPDLPRETINLPIGRPRGDRKAYVLDELGRPVPIGIPGELHIGGTMLARGYHKQPKLTETRFIQNPFSDDPDARLYKTGDLVRYLEDGTLEFLGRLDDQVKIRGYRIELGEVEANLRQHPGVRECLVLARTGRNKEKQLVAYALQRGSTSSADLRSHLRKRLPHYMLPSYIVLLDKWPILANGKIDRNALPEPDSDLSAGPVFAGPRNPLELQIQLLFERVLKRAPIGVDQSFFELGGDSLQALDLLIRIEKETGKQLPLGTLYQASTIEAIARDLGSRAAPETWSSLVPLQARGTRPPLYLLHTTPGDILGYGNLVYRLGADQPCYGFQSLGLKDAHLSHTSIEEMARYYVDLLRRFQPSGPYFLGGWCYGGVLAVEMARVLRAQGEEIGLLALLETVAMPARLTNLPYYTHRLRCFLRMSPAAWVVYAREKIRYRRNARLANRMRFRQVEQRAETRDLRLVQLEHVYNTNLAALHQYRSSFYDGTVTLFNAAKRDAAVIPDQHYGWIGLARNIEIHEVPGDHDTMLTEPNVSTLAEQLNQRLREAQKKLASP